MTEAVALIPVLDEPGVLDRMTAPLDGRGGLARTIEAMHRELPEVPILVTTDSPMLRGYVAAKFPFVRLHARTQRDYVASLVGALDTLPSDPEAVLIVECTHPFRPAGLFGKLLSGLAGHRDMDSVVCVRQLKGMLWHTEADGTIFPAQELDDPSPHIFFQELVGLGLATRPRLLRIGRRLGDNVGFEVVDDIWSLSDLRDDRGVRRAQAMAGLISSLEVS
jgi:hypothetical protein